MSTRWFTGIALADGLPELVPVLPIGEFKTAKYGKFSVTPEAAEEMVANFEANTLKTDVRFDIGHSFAEAAGWIKSLAIGTYVHPKTGEEMPGLVAAVEWTEGGAQLLSDKQYRYVSAAFGDYKDEETGTVHKNVLQAVSLTNDPVMKMLPPLVALSDGLKDAEHIVALGIEPKSGMRERIGAMFSGLFALGEVADKAAENRNAYPEGELEAAGWGVWDATSAFETLVRKAISDGLEGDDLMARIIEELAADLPLAVIESIKSSVEREKERAEGGAREVPPEPTDPTEGVTLSDADRLSEFDALMEACEEEVSGVKGVREFRTFAKASRAKLAAILEAKTAKPTGGEDMTEEQVKLAEEQRDQALKELAEYKDRERTERIKSLLDGMSAKGLTEPSRAKLEAALTSSGMVMLAEGNEVTQEDALLLALADAEFVPVDAAGSQEPPADGLSVEVKAAKERFDKQVGMA